MNKLIKVLRKKGIIWNYDKSYNNNDFDSVAKLVAVSKDFIIVKFNCLTMPTELRIYDKGLRLVGGQDLQPEPVFTTTNPWHSFANNFVPSDEPLPFY